MREFLVEQTAKSEVDRFHNDRHKVTLRRQKWRRAAWLEDEVSTQPLDLDSQPVGILVKPVIRLIRRAIPVDDAAITGDLEQCIRKEMLEGAPQHHLVEADDP